MSTKKVKSKQYQDKRFKEMALKKKNRPLKKHFKTSVQVKRRQNFFSNGEGSVGVCFRIPRLKKLIYRIVKQKSEEHFRLTGVEEHKIPIYETFFGPIIGSFDRLCNKQMEITSQLPHNSSKKSKQKGGMKLKKSDLAFVQECYDNISTKEK